MDLPFFFRYKHITSPKSLPLPAPSESLPNWFQGNFAAVFVLNFWLIEFLLSAFANRFELRCEPKQLMPLNYKICPCFTHKIPFKFKATLSHVNKRFQSFVYVRSVALNLNRILRLINF